MESVPLSAAFSTFLIVDKSNGSRRGAPAAAKKMYTFKAADWSNKLRSRQDS